MATMEECRRRLTMKNSAQLSEAALELLDAAIMLERAELGRQNCEECEGEGEPEACEVCFPSFDDARVARRCAIFKATGLPMNDVASDSQ